MSDSMLSPASDLREPWDAPATRQAIFDRVAEATGQLEPVGNTRFQMRLSDVGYDPKYKDPTIADQKKAVLTGQSVGRKLYGTWNLNDATSGQQVESQRMLLGQVPYMTNRGTFIHNGTEFSLSNQLRLLPGVYTRRKANGETEAHVNAKGRGHRINIDPKTGVYRMNIGQANIPLLPILRLMGARDQQLRDAWGEQMYGANRLKENDQAITKLHSKLFRDGGKPGENPARAVVEALQKMELDPEVTRRTLGQPFDRMNLDVMMAITKKLRAVSRDEEDPDDRDAMANQRFVGPEDLFGESVRQIQPELRRLIWKVTGKGNLSAIKSRMMDNVLSGTILRSGLGQPLEMINMAELLDQQSRVTRMGRGGLPSADSAPAESRAVQPSQVGFVDFLRTAESDKAGLDLRLASNARKGRDGRLYSEVHDPRTGQKSYQSAQTLADKVLGMPEAMREDQEFVPALVRGQLETVPRSEVDFVLPSMDRTFSPLGNLVPLKSAIKGQRAIMAARMITQAMPLEDPEAPFVQNGVSGRPGWSYEDEYGKHLGAVRAEQPAVVEKVTPEGISLRQADGSTKNIELYQNYPFNRKSSIHQTPKVQVGQQVRQGDLLATSSYTDGNGAMALGKNARVAMLPDRGWNFEDGISVSESYAQRMKSKHSYQHAIDFEPDVKSDKNTYVSLFSRTFDRKQLDKLDKQGIVQPGMVVSEGDPLILQMRPRELSRHNLHGGRKNSFTDETVTWDHQHSGKVVDVAVTEKGVNVVVQTAEPLQRGDKLSGRAGDKGVLARVIPDDQMPIAADGKPVEVLLNPLGTISRTNAATVIESALGKIAAITGKPYKVEDFDSIDDLSEFARKELQRHGLKDKEDITDPVTGRKITGVTVGNRWLMKLHHTADSKIKARSSGGYTQEGSPSRGGYTGSKRVGMLELGAALSHGATAVIADNKLVRGQANPEFWAKFMAGEDTPVPKIPFVHEKFVNQLKGSGINVVRDGPRTHIMAMTDRDVDQLAEDREIKNSHTVDWKRDMAEIEGGLFDTKLTGGNNGSRWSFVKLHEPMPSPLMEQPIRRVLGLTEDKFRAILAGKEQLGGATGPEALHKALSNINLDRELEYARRDLHGSRKTARDTAIRKFGYLKSAQQLGMHPKDWMLTKVPVLPPVFRPVSTLGPNKLPLVDDANMLYQSLIEANNNLRDAGKELTDVGDERLAVYDSFKAVTGLGDPIHPQHQEKNVRGLLARVFGSSPKQGTIQKKLLGTTVDLVGRSVISPDPNLNMDQVGIPEVQAWEIYRPFIVRNLVRGGMPRVAATEAVKSQAPAARQAMLKEMGSRPVVVTRAPTLHRYGKMAAWPKLVTGNTLRVSPLTVGGFGADFDGDQMNFHVPVGDRAVKDALDKMLPSANLFNVAKFSVHQLPSQEYVAGLHEASAREDRKTSPAVFRSRAEAIAAYRRGDIPVDRRVTILGEQDAR